MNQGGICLNRDRGLRWRVLKGVDIVCSPPEAMTPNQQQQTPCNLYNILYRMKTNEIYGYEIVRNLGEGSFGQVLLGKKNQKLVAIKKISKKQIIKVNKLHEPFIEKQILYRLNDLCKYDDFFIKILETESDDDNMYLILEYCSGGTLEDLILNQKLQLPILKRLAIKIVLILEKLSHFSIVHRDLKPSNFLIDAKGYIKLADFGTAYAPDKFFTSQIAAKIRQVKQMSNKKQQKNRKASQTFEVRTDRKSTFVGTACYMSPELLSNDTCGKQADIWAFGCILYEMLFKKSPFSDANEGMIWKKILNETFQISQIQNIKDAETLDMVDLIKKILVKQVENRLGSGQNGYKNIKSHPYFKNVDWDSERKKGIFELVQLIKNRSALQKKKNLDKVIFSGVVNKKMFFGNFKQRTLILYSTPKLVYYCTQSGQKKGEIALVKNTPVGTEGKIFTITNQKKTYYFKSKTTHEWVEMIKNSIINAYY